MTARPCLRCGRPTWARFCPACLPQTHRYRPERWKRLSARYRRLYGCVVCGTRIGTQLHHIVPLAQDGAEFDPTNLEVRCQFHHAEAHR